MTLQEIASAIRQKNPTWAAKPDAQILWDLGQHLKQQGTLQEYPDVERELVRQQAEYDASKRGGVATIVDAAQRGFAQGAQGFNVMQGGENATNAQDIVKQQRKIDENPVSPEFKAFMQADGFADSAKAFARAPHVIIPELIFESLGQSLPSILGGAAAGAAAGPWGAAAGAGAGSLLTEYSSGILQSLQESGMDINDPESI